MKETSYLLQAALICVWWAGLSWSPSFFAAFQFEQISATAFWSFFAPDILLIATLSILRAYRNITELEWIVLGAFGYASLYCVNATLLTGTGWLPSGLMLLGLGYNLFLCLHSSLFRASHSHSIAINGAKTLIQILCIWTVALVAIPYVLMESFGQLTMPAADFRLAISLILFVGCSLLGLTSSFFMVRDGHGTPLPLDQTNRLVESGPYRFVRNPMAIAGIGQGLAIAILFQSLPILVYALLGAVVWHFVVRPIEERDMVQRFGQPYRDYQNRVRCWIPTFSSNAPR